VAEILTAQDHINMETYILEDDEVGQRFARALIDKQKAGIQVNLIRDSIGTLGTPDAFFERMTCS
jgi:cardiolipin synthase